MRLLCTEELAKLREAEKHSGLATDPAMDAFLRAMTIEGEESSIVTEYMLKILGLDVSPESYQPVTTVCATRASRNQQCFK